MTDITGRVAALRNEQIKTALGELHLNSMTLAAVSRATAEAHQARIAALEAEIAAKDAMIKARDEQIAALAEKTPRGQPPENDPARFA